MTITRIAQASIEQGFFAPYFIAKVPAGFPSPADDYMDRKLDLNEYLIKHQSATFYCRVTGDSMKGIGIHDCDLLIVDRSLTAKHGDVVLAVLNGDLTCKILDTHNKRLLSSNDQYKPILIKDDSDFEVEGVVIHSIRSHRVCTG